MLYQLSYRCMEQRSRRQAPGLRGMVSRDGFEPPTRWASTSRSTAELPKHEKGDRSGVCQVASASRPGRTCFFARVERAGGLEPPTSSLATKYSTAELCPHEKRFRANPLPVVLAAGVQSSGRGLLPFPVPGKGNRGQEVIRPATRFRRWWSWRESNPHSYRATVKSCH